MKPGVWGLVCCLLVPLAAEAQVVTPPDPAGARRDVEAARAKLSQQKFDEAVALLRRASAADPNSAAIARDLGYALRNVGQWREAEGFLRRAISLDPRYYSAYAELAQLLAEAPDRWQRRDDVVATLERGLAALRDDDNGRQWVTLELAAFERSVGRLPQARKRLAALLAAELPGTLRQRAVDLEAQISADERAQRLSDWPEGALGEADRTALRKAEDALDGAPDRALTLLAPILDRVPGAAQARWLRARALEKLERYDQATRELTILLQLRPSHAGAWRQLGLLLATHGGTLDADRADEALRHALVLEPSWDDLRAVRKRVAQKRDPGRAGPTIVPAPPPSAKAQKLLADAQRWITDGAREFAEPLVVAALAESPGYVEAAATHFALSGVIPERSVQAVANDPEALMRLAAAVQASPDMRPGPVVARFLDRAIALGSSEARWRRAVLRATSGDQAGALADLTEYVAGEPSPPHLDEARALRATITPAEPGSTAWQRQTLEALLADRPRDAVRFLGGNCQAELAPERLVEIGRVHEYEGDIAGALGCYKLGLEVATRLGPPAARAAQTALARLGAAAAHAPLELVEPMEKPLRAARRAGVTPAALALARLAQKKQQPEEARVLYTAFLAETPASDPAVPEVKEALAALAEREQAELGARVVRRSAAGWAAVAVLALLLAFLILRRFRGATVPRALARRPALFPELARAVAEVRHDVLKHRASVLGAEDGRREDMARALLEPRPASSQVAEIYERVEQAAAGLGLALRPLDREPTFGPLARTLRQAEATVQKEDAPLGDLDRRLREDHAARLGHLLTLGPRTILDAARLTRWIRAVEAEGEGPAPGLVLRQIDLAVAVEEDTLFTIVSNLLRNARQAVGQPDGRVVLRVDSEVDVSGRRMVTLLVADSAPHAPTPAEIEARDGQRGLGIVRDLVRRWGGHLVVRSETAPLAKSIGASFPAALAERQAA